MTTPLLAEATSFHGLLFPDAAPDLVETEPGFFADLNLDQFVATLLAGRQDYRLAPFLYTLPGGPETVEYRQEVVRDLESADLRAAVTAFGHGMRAVRKHLARTDKVSFAIQQQAVFLAAAETYVDAVNALGRALEEFAPISRALAAFHEYLRQYVASQAFQRLCSDAADARGKLSSVTYRLKLLGDTVTVSPVRDEEDYTADVVDAFARFREGEAESHLSKLKPVPDLNHVESQIVLRVAKLHPEPFETLAGFCRDHRAFLDEALTAFDREVQFFLAALEHADRMRSAGLPVCLPALTDANGRAAATDAYDPVLAEKLRLEDQPVVCNDVEFSPSERLLVITGPNHGGKTTFARTIAILHYLAALGLPVPAEQAQLQLVDQIFTHFERGENLDDLTGKLEDDLARIRAMLDAATPRSLVVLNEIFNSTSLEDAVTLGTRVIERLTETGTRGVCVTFLDELSHVNDAAVSMVGQVDLDDPARRTFEVVRRPADGRAYAEAIAHKYGVTYEALKARLAR